MAEDAKGVEFSHKLRFGIMCTGDKLPAAFAKCLEELLSIRGLELALLIIDASPPTQDAPGRGARTVSSFKGALWARHVRSFPSKLPCYQAVDMSQTFTAVPGIHCRTIRNEKSGEYFRSEDIEIIHGYKLDFILQFAFGIICGDILEVARHGVWSFHYGNHANLCGDPPAFWEVYRGDPVTGATLQRLTGRTGEGVVLQKCFIKTRECSHGENLDAIMWATTHMPGRVCRDIFNECAQYLNSPPCRTDAPVFHSPNNVEMVNFFFKTATTWVKQQFESILFSEGWNVGVVQKPIHAFLDPNFRPQVEWLPYQKANYYLADPFLLKIGPKLKLLAEEFDYHSDRGSIVETELNNDGPYTVLLRKAFDVDVHASYPYLFEHEGRYYCTPETFQKRSVSLYVLDIEREVWSPVATIIQDFAAVDPTLFQYAGRWWLFCTNHDDEVESKLFLWHAPKLLGPWKPHPGNPVKVDVRSSRPAGRPFVFERRLYRPAQDSSLTYGGAITINRITCLTTQEFSEEPAVQIGPIGESPYRRGIHTAVCQGSITVIDGNRLVFAPELVWRRIKHKLRKFVGQNEV